MAKYIVPQSNSDDIGDGGNTGMTDINSATFSAPANVKGLTASRGDLVCATSDGTGLARLAVGPNGHALVADSSSATGLAYANVDSLIDVGIFGGGGGGSTSLPTTTKGDLVVHNGGSNTRLPVGTDGSVLVARATSSAGVGWARNVRYIHASAPEHQSTKSTSYTTVDTLIYPGDATSTISRIHMTLYVENDAVMDARVVRHDTGEVLATKTGIDNENEQVHTFSSLSDVPSTTTNLRVQIRRDSSSKNKRVYYVACNLEITAV